jgi:hypothetical protein
MFLKGNAMPTDHDARAILQAMQEGRTEAEFIEMIWSSRYPTPSLQASDGWPYRTSTGVTESKLRKIK